MSDSLIDRLRRIAANAPVSRRGIYEEAADELARIREVIEKELARHTEKHGARPVYAPDDYQAELEPVDFESYMICNACGTTFPCKTRKNLAAYDQKEKP